MEPEKRDVLVVEDDADIRDTISQILEFEGYAVATARNGAEALAQMRRGRRPAVILLDLMMPGMNGWEFRSAQLVDPALADIPVVVLSGDRTVAAEAGDMKAAGFLTKPVELSMLLDTVRRFC